MIGWLWLALIAGAAFGALVALRVPRLLWSMVGAALMLGAAGYALQGSPGVPASPAVTASRGGADEQPLIDLRDAMFGRFTGDGAYLVAGDAMTRAGEPKAAAQVILGGIRAVPRSAALWTGLGSAIAARDGVVSPPARFAFEQARRLAPRHPGPLFFQGVAAVRSGDLAAARPLWVRALALTPPTLSYRGAIEQRLALLDRYLAEAEAPPRR